MVKKMEEVAAKQIETSFAKASADRDRGGGALRPRSRTRHSYFPTLLKQ
jgi:hypothetical protein